MIANLTLSWQQIQNLRFLVAQSKTKDEVYSPLVGFVWRIRNALRGDTSGKRDNLYVLIGEIERIMGWK